MTTEAWGVSTDGGSTWNAGMTVDGDSIVRILTATGINASWIDTGRIEVKDSSGNTIFIVDMDEKKVMMAGEYVQIGGKPVNTALNDVLEESKKYSDSKLADYANVVTGSLSDLQSQIDGQIETYYYDYEPSLFNYPASEWTSEEEREKHIGDLFYWKEKGYAYRFFKDGATWKWQLVQDTDITKALAQAEFAQNTANGKKRTFVVEPQPPYDVGDLWTNGTDILTCTVSREAGTPYVSSDWKKLNNYTDDTVANEALDEAKKARNLNIILDNEYQGIPTDSVGNYTAFPDCQTFVQTFYGQKDVSNLCTYTIQTSSGISGNWDNEKRIYTVTGLSSKSGFVDITATYLNLFTVTKRFTVAKQYAGVQGIPGKDGTDGKTQYTHLAYANSEDGQTDFSVDDSDRSYIGMYVDFNSESSMDPSDYSWTLIKGRDGEQGIPGKQGENGLTPYVHIAYANSADGQTDFSLDNSTDKKYFGQYTDYLEESSEDPERYRWTLIRGNDGLDGRVYHLRANTTILLMGKDDKVTPEKLVVNAYYRDGQEDEKPYNGWWKAERSTDSGTTWTTIGLSQSTATNSCAITSSLQIIGTHGMIRVTCYSDQAKTKVVDSQTYSVAVDVENLKQSDIVDILSNSGKWKGLYYLNGNLYMSFDAALGGTLTLGGKNNGNGLLKILDENGEQVGFINNTGVNFQKGNIRGSKIVTGDVGDTRRIEIDQSEESFYIDTVDEDGYPYDDDLYTYAGCITPVKEKGGITSDYLVIDGEVPGIGIEAAYFFTMKLDQTDIFHVDRSQTRINNMAVIKRLSVTGTKNRAVDTANYQTQYMHSYETTYPMFGDIGTSRLNEFGEDVVAISDIFLETVNTNVEYQVFLQKEGRGDIWVEEKNPLYFKVCGTPDLKYSWEIKAVQREYEHIRFDDISALSDQDSELDNLDKQTNGLQEQELRELEEANRQMLAETERGIKNENSVNDINHQSWQ